MTTSNQVRNIIVGAAAVFLSVKDSDDSTWYDSSSTLSGPKGPIAASGVSVVNQNTGQLPIPGDWRNVGFTKDGLELSYEPDYGEVEVDQLLDAARLFKQGMKVSLKTTFAEATLENLLIAWGQKDSAASSTNSAAASAADVSAYGSAYGLGLGEAYATIASGQLGDDPIERALVAVGPGPRAVTGGSRRERVYHARRVLSVESSSQALKRNEATVFPVSFRLLPEINCPTNAEYGIIRDRNVS